MDMNDQSSRQRVVESAKDMATEMDNVARLTGISRQEQQKAIDAQMKKAEVELSLAAMDEDQREAYLKSTTELGKYGKEFQDVLTIYATGGVRNAEDNAKVAAMGPKFAGLIEQMANIKGTTEADEKRRRQIQSEIDAEALRLSKDKDELRLRASGATSMGDFGRAQAEVTRNVLNYGQMLKNAELEAIKNKTTVDQELQKMLREAEEKRKAALTSLEPGALINRTETLIKDISAGAGKGFSDLNEKTKTLMGSISGLNDVLVPMTRGDVVRKMDKILASINPNPVNQAVANQNPDILRRERERNNPERQQAFGGNDLPYLPHLVGEFGPELRRETGPGTVTASDRTFNLFDDINRTFPTVISGLKSEMKTELAKAKDSMPTVAQFEQVFEKMISGGKREPAPVIQPDNSVNKDTNAKLDQLNTNVRELITAVKDGTYASVRAVNANGNVVAS
jgi:hypothetical protein